MQSAHPTLLGRAVAPRGHLELLADRRPDWQGAPVLGSDPHDQAKGGVRASLQHSLAGRKHSHIPAVRGFFCVHLLCPYMVGSVQKVKMAMLK